MPIGRSRLGVMEPFACFFQAFAQETCAARSQQVIFRVVTAATTSVDVMDLQLSSATARLTPPTIAREHTPTELIVGSGIKPLPPASGRVPQAVPP